MDKTPKKKGIRAILLSLAMVLAMLSGSVTSVSAKAAISAKKLTMTVGEKKTLKVTGASGTVKWSTSDKKVAAVTQKGKVTAKAAGKATIKAKAGNITMKCTVTVKEKQPENSVKGITAYTYVGAKGVTVTKLVYELEKDYATGALTRDSFTVTDTAEPLAYLGQTEPTVTHVGVKGVSVDGNLVTLQISDTLYTSGRTLEVACTDSLFQCNNETITEVKTRTVDDFTKNTFTSSEGTEIVYYLYVPEGKTNLPLMIWEHGGGDDLEGGYEGANLRANRGAVTWIESAKEDTAVLSVQFPSNYPFQISVNKEEMDKMKALNVAQYELIQKLIQEGTVVASRIYLAGLSSGGGGSIRFAMQYPQLFAGIVAMCAKDTVIPLSYKYDLAYKLGNNDLLRISDADYAKEKRLMEIELEDSGLENIPIWFFHAENDQICTSYNSKLLYEVLQEKGASHNRLTIYSDEEMMAAGIYGVYHGCWEIALEDEGMIDWIYSQKK